MASRHIGLKALVAVVGTILVVVAVASLTYLAYEMVKTGHALDTFALPTTRGGLWRTYTSWLVDLCFLVVAIIAAIVATLWYRYLRRPVRRAIDE